MNESSDWPMIPPYRCRDCGSQTGFRSRRRSLAERFLLPLFLLHPVRCAECFRRDYRLIFTPVRERLADIPKIAPGKVTPNSNRNVA
jgi:hypothetical protein